MNRKTYHYKYRDCLFIKYAHIVYYEDSNDPENQTVLQIMERMCLEYPRVNCQRFLWDHRKMKSVEINAKSASDILCFKDKKQIYNVHAFSVKKLDTLFKTVYNDCVENSLSTFNRFLISKGLMKIGEEHVKYVIEYPSYIIPKNNRTQISELNSLISCQFQSQGMKRHMEIKESNQKTSDEIPRVNTVRKIKRKLSDNHIGFSDIQKMSDAHKKISCKPKTLNYNNNYRVRTPVNRNTNSISTSPHLSKYQDIMFKNNMLISPCSVNPVNSPTSNFKSCMYASPYPMNSSNIIKNNASLNMNSNTLIPQTNYEIFSPQIIPNSQNFSSEINNQELNFNAYDGYTYFNDI